MRNNKKFLGLAGLALAAGVLGGTIDTASATPATLGFYPATDIYGKGTFHLDIDTYGSATRMDAFTSAGVTYGFGPQRDGVFGRSEVGFDYVLSSGGSTPAVSGSKRFLLNAKTQLYNNDVNRTRVVTGIWGLGSRDMAAPNVAYVTGSKAFDWGRVHVGVAQSLASRSIIATPAGNDDRTFLHLAYDRPISSRLGFAVDYYSGKSAVSGIQPSLYYAVNDKASFGLGLMRFNDSSISPRNQTYICFDYNFGGGSSSTAEPVPAAPPTQVPVTP